MALKQGDLLNGKTYSYEIKTLCGGGKYTASVLMSGSLGTITTDQTVKVVYAGTARLNQLTSSSNFVELLQFDGKSYAVLSSEHVYPEQKNDTKVEPDENWVNFGTARYKGEMKDGQPNGHGVMHGSDHSVYEGEWVNGRRNGRGRSVWPDGFRYDGQWKDNEITGYGVMDYPDKRHYEGYFVKGLRHGKGKLVHPSGEWFEGYFENGNITENGTYYTASGKPRTIDYEKAKEPVKEKKKSILWDKTWRLFAAIGCFAGAGLSGWAIISFLDGGGGTVRVGGFIAPFLLAFWGFKLLVNFFSYLFSSKEVFK